MPFLRYCDDVNIKPTLHRETGHRRNDTTLTLPYKGRELLADE